MKLSPLALLDGDETGMNGAYRSKERGWGVAMRHMVGLHKRKYFCRVELDRTEYTQ